MNENFVTDTTYPIQPIWIFKAFVGFFIALAISLVLFIFGVYNLYLVILVIYSPIHFILIILRRKKFHYSLDPHFLTLKQGIITKQEKHIPYGVIQNLYVKQDVFDRVFGLASLTIENAAQGGQGITPPPSKFFGMTVKNTDKKGYGDLIGFSGNTLTIPGLQKTDAEALKGALLQRMKDNPLEETHSGL